jgi:nitroimidazol reductase NimA-like FMN-containing flavoprotein (pyridoxamine 5'-phosphate oxidase superfamily)
MTQVQTSFDARYSQPDADPSPWDQVSNVLAEAELYWLTTIRADGRPHVCPLVGLWFDDHGWFVTGPEEQKAQNLAVHDQVALTTGTNTWAAGLDVVVEGRAARTTAPEDLRRAAEAYQSKYGDAWPFTVDGDGLNVADGQGAGGLYVVTPSKVLAFGKEPHSQTAYRFG